MAEAPGSPGARAEGKLAASVKETRETPRKAISAAHRRRLSDNKFIMKASKRFRYSGLPARNLQPTQRW